MKLVGATFLIIFFSVSCGNDRVKQTGADVKREWDRQNAPERIGLKSSDYQPNFETLPKDGSLTKRPWSGDYWPTYKGGITYRWNHSLTSDDSRIFYPTTPLHEITNSELIKQMSPAEKYDILLNREDYPFTSHERKRTSIMKLKDEPSFKIPHWEGLCHAWAPATHLFDNPMPVTLKNSSGLEIPFGSSDIKALLTYFLHFSRNVPTYFVSRRCNINDEELRTKLHHGHITKEEYNRQMESAECRGVNAGAFHIILTNLIGIKKESFIADVTRDLEVWNQAVHGYKTEKIQEKTEIHPEAAPGTVKEILMRTRMFYTVEIGYSWNLVETPRSETYLDYEYWLEVDSLGNIIGGRWESHVRPDFFWRQELPNFTGIWSPLEKIYLESTMYLRKNDPINHTEEPTDQSDKNVFNDIDVKVNKGRFRTKIVAQGKLPDKATRGDIKYILNNGKIFSTKPLSVDNKGTFKAKMRLFFVSDGKVVVSAYDEDDYIIDEREYTVSSSS